VIEKPKQKKTVEQVSLEHDYREKYGVGYKMLAKMGFIAGEGLGKEGKGIKAPVDAVFKTALLA
jgi:tuftelin-interacting protein 11